MNKLSAAIVCCLASVVVPAVAADAQLASFPGQAEVGTVEIHGVAAGAFNPAHWKAGTLNLVPDVRQPLIAPRLSGVFRNIYAPSAVEMEGGWRVFYGAWDGVHTGNDRIYSVTTRDFLDFGERTTVIEHGDFVHCCNVSATGKSDGGWAMVCTVYPDEKGLNKPAVFTSPDGKRWNGTSAPHPAGKIDMIQLEGYEPFAAADINGLNALAFEDGQYRLYFGNFEQHTHVRRASSKDGRTFRYDGECLASGHAVNDVKKLAGSAAPVWLMGLHMNTDTLWYSLSADGMHFEPEQVLAKNLGPADRYIVAIGWVTNGNRLLGVLYGAGAKPSLDRNRIFVRWLQKKVVFTDGSGKRHEPAGSLGPDRQVIDLGAAPELTGSIEVLAEDGRTRIAGPLPVKLVSGATYRLAVGSRQKAQGTR